MSEDLDTLARRLAAVHDRIERAALAAGRDPDEVTLVGITKTHPPVTAQRAVDLGVVDLGENRVEEAVAKADRVTGARWHFVGQLQSRKANLLVGRDWLIHSVDRRSLVDRIQRLAEEHGVSQRVLIQVNVGEDPAKAGCELDEVDDLVAYARGCANLAVEGLMTMPPLPPEGADPVEAARPHFARLREVRDRVAREAPEVRQLSMGMTADLEAAVAEGATLVRIGTALFGERGPQPWRP